MYNEAGHQLVFGSKRLRVTPIQLVFGLNRLRVTPIRVKERLQCVIFVEPDDIPGVNPPLGMLDVLMAEPEKIVDHLTVRGIENSSLLRAIDNQ